MSIGKYVDLHCHILPGVDDGAADVEQSQRMLRMAAQEGICEMIATPHYKAGRGRRNATCERVRTLVQEMQDWLDSESIPIHLYTGNEILYNYEIDNLLESHEVCTLADSFYVLVEFSPSDEYSYIKNGVQKILMAGYVPVIAHIERYEVLRKHTAYVEELTEMGAYLQVNAASITGKSGWLVKRCVLKWIRDELIYAVASDTHDDRKRVPVLGEAYDIIEKRCGSEVAQMLFYQNPKRILETKIEREQTQVG